MSSIRRVVTFLVAAAAVVVVAPGSAGAEPITTDGFHDNGFHDNRDFSWPGAGGSWRRG